MQSVIKFFNKQANKLEKQHKKALKEELEGHDKFKDATITYGYYRTLYPLEQKPQSDTFLASTKSRFVNAMKQQLEEMNEELLVQYMDMVNYKVRAIRENRWIDFCKIKCFYR